MAQRFRNILIAFPGEFRFFVSIGIALTLQHPRTEQSPLGCLTPISLSPSFSCLCLQSFSFQVQRLSVKSWTRWVYPTACQQEWWTICKWKTTACFQKTFWQLYVTYLFRQLWDRRVQCLFLVLICHHTWLLTLMKNIFSPRN